MGWQKILEFVDVDQRLGGFSRLESWLRLGFILAGRGPQASVGFTWCQWARGVLPGAGYRVHRGSVAGACSTPMAMAAQTRYRCSQLFLFVELRTRGAAPAGAPRNANLPAKCLQHHLML